MKGIILMGVLAVVCCFQGHALTTRDPRNDTVPTVLTYGFRMYELERARDVVAQKYGFRFFAVAGCVVTKQLVDSVKKENDAVYAILEKKLGKNWEKRFDKDLYFLITPLPNSREWEVKAYGWVTEEYTEPLMFYKMKADPDKKKIELLSSKPEKIQVD